MNKLAYRFSVENRDDVQTIINALRVAEEVYRKDARDSHVVGHDRLAEQFKRQANDVVRIADELEEQI
jgi:hypothetical protein